MEGNPILSLLPLILIIIIIGVILLSVKRSSKKSTEKLWYYIRENKQVGPISESKLKELVDTGQLDRETLIWSESMQEWAPASKLILTDMKSTPTLSPMPEKVLPASIMKQTEKIPVGMVSPVRPWVRYWARSIDYMLFSFIFVIIAVLFFPSVLRISEVARNMLALFIWVFVEASLLSSWGTTPGKWLLRTSIRDAVGQKPTFSNALSRSFGVWWRGMGAGFPIATLITLIVSHGKLTKDGITHWDREGGIVVSHKKIGLLRIILAILLFVGFFSLIVLGQLSENL